VASYNSTGAARSRYDDDDVGAPEDDSEISLLRMSLNKAGVSVNAVEMPKNRYIACVLQMLASI
jgi:hypothetical protein